MSQSIYAHSLPGQPPEKWQPLEEHLKRVAEKAGEFAAVLLSKKRRTYDLPCT